MQGLMKRQDWVFLSPHADDAIWSVGGIIAASAASRTTAIVTVFDAPAKSRAARHDEDRNAAVQVSANLIRLGLPEATQRMESGGALYPSALSLRRQPHPLDDIEQQAARALLPLLANASAIFIPAAKGTHVDHTVVRRAALSAAPPHAKLLSFHEFPYCRKGSVAEVQQLLALPCWPKIWEKAAIEYISEAHAMFGSKARFEAELGEFIVNEIVRNLDGWTQSVVLVNREI